MDLHSIGPAIGPVPESQQQGKNVEAVRESKTIPDRPSELDVRTRDPRSLQYQVDGTTHQVVATIVDESSKTVVVQIPSEEVLRIAKAIDRLQGFLLEGKA